MRVYYDRDADVNLIKSKNVAIVGYGSQGHAHAMNLRDSGVKNVRIALRANSATRKKAEAANFVCMTPAECAVWADIVVMLTPDELQADIYTNDCRRMKEGATLAFAHGLNVHFNLIEPRADLDVIMIAPKGQATRCAQNFCAVVGCQPLWLYIAINPAILDIALSYASANGEAPGSLKPISARNVKPICLANMDYAGMVELIRQFETLVDAGYAPEMAYFECLHETKLIVDLIYEGGIANMNYSISNTAEYGEYVTGPRIITDETKAEMKRVLADIQSGKFTRDWMLENKVNQAPLRRRDAVMQHPIEELHTVAQYDA